MSQKEMAEKLGVLPSTFNNWEKGKRDTPTDIIRELLKLGATVEELFDIDCQQSCPHAKHDREEIITKAQVQEMINESLGVGRKQLG